MRTSAADAYVSRFCGSRRALYLAIASVLAYLVARWLTAPSMIDLAVYRVEGDAIRSGLDLYGTLPTPHGLLATYPPFAAIAFVPFSLLPWTSAQILVSIANLVVLYVVCGQACRLVGLSAEQRPRAALLLAAASIWAEPVFTTFRYGQINLVLLALVLWDFLRPASARTRGVGIGLATALKVTPGLFVVYLLMTRRFRMAAVAAATFAATLALSVAVVPRSTLKFWTSLLFDTTRVGRLENAANQSVRGLAVRIMHARDPGTVWLLVGGAVLVGGLLCSVYVQRRLGDRWGVPACAVAGMLGAPISWSHHWVWCVPIAALLWYEARRWVPALVVFWTPVIWLVPHRPHPSAELHLAGWQIAISAWYVLFGLGFLALAYRRAAPVAIEPASAAPGISRSDSRAG